MTATYQAPNVTTFGYIPPGSGHGEASVTQHLHAKVYCSAALGANDVLQFGYLPPNAVVIGAILKADTQLDSNGSPTLTFDLGVTGTAQLFKAAVTTVGRAAGASADTTLAGAGALYKNATGAKIMVIGTAHASAATGAAGSVEADIAYFVEDTAGSQS
ncbi:MAG: hypothetical protein ACREEB_13125 [Caulobacteraceae bacterium]